jgi:hypothetical protein
VGSERPCPTSPSNNSLATQSGEEIWYSIECEGFISSGPPYFSPRFYEQKLQEVPLYLAVVFLNLFFVKAV